jgi:hypothetical protein
VQCFATRLEEALAQLHVLLGDRADGAPPFREPHGIVVERVALLPVESLHLQLQATRLVLGWRVEAGDDLHLDRERAARAAHGGIVDARAGRAQRIAESREPRREGAGRRGIESRDRREACFGRGRVDRAVEEGELDGGKGGIDGFEPVGAARELASLGVAQQQAVGLLDLAEATLQAAAGVARQAGDAVEALAEFARDSGVRAWRSSLPIASRRSTRAASRRPNTSSQIARKSRHRRWSTRRGVMPTSRQRLCSALICSAASRPSAPP